MAAYVRLRHRPRQYTTRFDDPVILRAWECATDPKSFYDVTRTIGGSELRASGPHRFLRDVCIRTLNYSPPFYHPTHTDSSGQQRTNHVIVVSRKRSRAQLAFILLHAWSVKRTTKSDIDLAVSLAEQYDITTYLPTLPLHRERTPLGYRSGELALNGDAAACLNSFRQAVEETIALRSHLIQKGFVTVGVGGMSLGGIIANVCAFLAPFRFGCFMYSSGFLADVVWSSDRLTSMRHDLESVGIDREGLRRLWTVIDPVSFIPSSATHQMTPQLLFITGKYDRLIWPDIARRFHERIGQVPGLHAARVEVRYSHHTGVYFAGRLWRHLQQLPAIAAIGDRQERVTSAHTEAGDAFKMVGQIHRRLSGVRPAQKNLRSPLLPNSPFDGVPLPSPGDR